MKQLTNDQLAAIVRCLADGVSVRATCRITGFAKATVQKLPKDLGEAMVQLPSVRRATESRLESMSASHDPLPLLGNGV